MKRLSHDLSRWAFVLAVVALVTVPAAAQDIPAGDDTWATPGGGDTWIELSGADWKAICGKSSSAAVQVVFKGVELAGQGDGSVVVSRLADAKFDSSGIALVPVQVTALGFQSTSTSKTPCGNLDFQVGLNGRQETAQMEIRRESAAGGHFFVDLPVDAVIEAIDPASGEKVGSVIKEGLLREPSTGTPWSYDPPPNALDPDAPWNPGVTRTGVRVTIVRHHTFPAQHAYRPVIFCSAVGTASTSAAVGVEPSPCPQPVDPVERVER